MAHASALCCTPLPTPYLYCLVVLAGDALYVIMSGSCQVRARPLRVDPAAAVAPGMDQLLGSFQQHELLQQQQKQTVQLTTASTMGIGHSTLKGDYC